MPGLLLPSQIGSKVVPPFGGSPVEDDPLFGEAGADQLDPVPPGNWDFGDDVPGDPNDTLQPEPGVNAMPEAEADAIARDPRFNTQLTPDEEDRFLEWKQQNAPDDSGYDYDLKGAFRHGLTRDPETGHMLDTYKKPNHATFSDQSVYAQVMPEKAGRWDPNDNYIPAGTPAGDWDFGDEQQPNLDEPVKVDDGSGNAYGFGGRGDTYLERLKDRFYTGPDYNIAMNMVAHSGDIMEGIGSLIEGYGSDTLVSELGAKARAAGQSIGSYIRDKMDPEWVKAQEKSYLDFSENGALRDPKAFVMGITGQIPTIAATLGLGAVAGVGLEILGIAAPVAAVGGLMVGGAISTTGDAASSAADAIDAANLSPEERTKAERIAATAALPWSLAVGPFYGRLFSGGFGGLFGSLAATAVEEFTEEAGTEASAQLAKKAVGLPFEWKPILESGVQGAVTGVGIGGTVGAVHKYGAQSQDPNVKKALDSNAESEAIRAASEQRKADKTQAQLAQIEAEQNQLAVDQEQATPPPPGTPPGPPPEGAKPGTDFVAGMDPTAKQEQDRTNLMLGIVRHAGKMVTLQDRITAEPDKVKRAKLVGQFQKRHAERAAMVAELAKFPDAPLSRGAVTPVGEPVPGIPGQGGGVDLRPGVSNKAEPTPAPAVGTRQDTGYDLETAQRLGAAQNQLLLLQDQIRSTSDPNVRDNLVQQFRAARKMVQNMHHQIEQGQQRPDPTKPIDAEFRVIHDGPARLPAPSVQEITGVETTPEGKLPKVAAVSSPEGRAEGIRAKQQARLNVAAAKQAKQARADLEHLVPDVQDLDRKLGLLQEKINGPDATKHAPTRAKLVGQFRKLTQQHRIASEQLNEAIAKRDAVPVQPALPGFEEVPQARQPDYVRLARDLDRMMPGVGVDAMPIAPNDGTHPVEIGPIAEVFDKWVKKSQAAKAGWATRNAKRQQMEPDAGVEPEQEGGVEQLDQLVKVAEPNINPPPAPVASTDLPAETGHTASAGAELAAIRTRMPSRKPKSSIASISQALEAPPAAEPAQGGRTPPGAPTPAVRASQGPLAPSVDPVEAETAKRNQPQTQEQFVETAVSMNDFKQQTQAQMPLPVRNTEEVQLPDPTSPPWKVKEDADPPSTGILEAALQLEQQDPAQVEIAARSPRNVMARLLANGPVRVDTVLAHLRANLLVEKGSNLDLLMQRLAGAFPSTSGKPTSVMVDNSALPGGYQGLYDPKTDTVHIDLQQAEDVLQSVLHEIVHAAVAVRLTSLGFQEQLSKLVNQAKQYWTDSNLLPAVDEVYGFTNLNEFLSEALTNTDFQNQLKLLFDAEYDTSPSIWRKFKSRIATTLGFQAKTPVRDLFDALLEFVPDGKFLTHANREASLAELDRLGLAQPQALMSTLNAVFRPKSTPAPATPPAPRGRVRQKLLGQMSNFMINKSYAKFGKAFYNNVTNSVDTNLGDWVSRFFGMKDAMGGYAAAQQAKASKIVEVFKNAVQKDTEGKVGRIMERSRMYALDASKAANDPANAAGMLRPGALAAYNELQALWGQMTPAQRDTYELVRDHGDEIRFRQINDMMVEIVRQLAGDGPADLLANHIVARAPVRSAVGGRYNIDLSYNPIMSAAEIDTQVRRLVPGNPVLQKKIADGMKNTHDVLKHTPGPYFPLRRFGDHYVSFKSDEQTRVMSAAELDRLITDDRTSGDGTIQIIGKPVPVGGGRLKVKWRNEYYEEFDGENEAVDAHAKTLEAWKKAGRTFKLENAKFGLKTDRTFERGGLDFANIESLKDTLAAALGGTSGAAKTASDAAQQWFMERSAATSANKSRLASRNVAGASTDMLRAYAEYVHSTSFQQARIKYGPQLHRMLTQGIPADVRTMQAGGAGRQGADLQRIGEELKQREKLQMELASTERNHGSIMALWVKAPMIAASFYLTGVATMIVNSYQTINMTIPELGKEFGFPSAAAALLGAHKDIFLRNAWATAKETARAFKKAPGMAMAVMRGKPTPSFRDPMRSAVEQMTGHLPKGEQEAMYKLQEMRQLDFGLVADVQSVAFGNRAAGNLFTYLSEAAFIWPQAVEAQNRVSTALAAWRLNAKRMGLPRGASVKAGTMTQAQFDELVKVTVDKVKTTQIDYARDNKSPMMQKEGLRAALVFQNYAAQQFYTIGHNLLQMFRAETPQGRAEAIRFIGAWGATTIAIAGVAGVIKFEPIYLGLVALMMLFRSDEEDPEALLRSSMADWNKDLRNVLLKGAPYAAGVDVSRAGYSPVIPVDEMWKMYQDPHSGQKDWYSLIGKTLGGAPTDMVFKNIFGAASKAFVDGEPMKALEMLTPKAFGINDAIRAYNYAHSGVTTSYGNTVVPKEQITTKEKVVRALGFTPSSVAEAQAKRHAGSFSSSVVKADKYELLDSYAKAALAGKDMTAIVQQIIQFNKKNPADALTKASLIGSVKRRAKGEAMYNTFGVQVRSKGDIYRAQETAPEYDTGLEGAQQLKDNPDMTGTDPSMLGIAANIETMKNLHLRLGQSGKRSDNIMDLRAETKDISNIKTMDAAADRLRQLGTSEADVEFNVSEARRRTRTEPGAVLIMKDILLDELVMAMGRDNYNRLPMGPERPGTLEPGVPILARRKNARPVPQDRPKYYQGASPR